MDSRVKNSGHGNLRGGPWTTAVFPLVLFLLLSSGCANLNSIYRNDNLGSDVNMVSVDAKQRFLLSRDVPNGTEGTLRKLCAEPSPDVFSAFAASLSGSAKTKAFEAALNAAFSENAATIGIRTQAIQLLRDGMYRICEGVLNGELSEDDFLDLHRRYQRIMVTLVAIEQLTGAVRPPPVAIQTDAIGGRPARLNDLQDELEEAREKVATLEGEVETAGSENEFQRTDDDGNSVDVACSEATEEELQDEESCSELVKAKANLESAKANVKTLEKEVETVRSEIVNRASGSVKLVDNRSSNFNLDQQSVKKISETIKSMVASMFRLDPDSAISEYRKMKCSNVRDLYSQASTSDIFDNATWPDDKIAETREVLGLENFRLTNQEVRRATFEVLKAENEMCKALIDLVTNE